MKIYQSILDLIGKTPIVKLHKLPDKNGAEVFMKLESFNPGGSVKDRAALNMIEQAEKEGKLIPGKSTIIEPTSGWAPIPAEGTPKLVAHIDLAPGKQAEDELYDAIPLRHTNRSAYIPQKPLPPEFMDALTGSASDEPDVKMFLFTAEAERKKIVEISSAANREIYSDPEVDRASDRWVRINWSSVQKFRDGLTIDAFGMPPIATAVAKTMPLWMLKWAASRGAMGGYSSLMLSAPLIGIITVQDRYDQENCLRAGRIWQRAHLLATARGLAGRPCNEAVEMIDHERAHERPALRATLLGEILGDVAWQPTFVFYMGYPTLTARASPRRPIKSVNLLTPARGCLIGMIGKNNHA